MDDCFIEGNADLYGLGIRLGFYLQLLASYIANQASMDADVANLLDTNSTFMAAIFIAAVVLSSSAYRESGMGAKVEEVFIVLFMFFGTFWTSFSAYTKIHLVSGGGTYIRILLASAMSGYSVWFWYKGIDSLPQGQCRTYIFLFAKLSADGGTLTFFRILYTINFALAALISLPILASTTVFASVLLVFIGIEVWSQLFVRPRPKLKDAEFWRLMMEVMFVATETLDVIENDPAVAEQKAPKDDVQSLSLFDRLNRKGDNFLVRVNTTIEEWRGNGITKRLHLLELLLIAYTILAVEFTINWNNITDVYSISSTGQFIPLIIGLTGLWLVIMHIIQRNARLSNATNNGSLYKQSAEKKDATADASVQVPEQDVTNSSVSIQEL